MENYHHHHVTDIRSQDGQIIDQREIEKGWETDKCRKMSINQVTATCEK